MKIFNLFIFTFLLLLFFGTKTTTAQIFVNPIYVNNYETKTENIYGDCDSFESFINESGNWESEYYFSAKRDNNDSVISFDYYENRFFHLLQRRSVITRDSTKKPVVVENYYDPGFGLMKASRTQFIYGANGLVEKEELSNIEAQNWVNADRFLYTYDSKGNMLTKEMQKYNANTSKYEDFFKYVFTYNAADQLIKAVSSYYNTAAVHNWKDSLQLTYTYNSAGQLSNVLQETNAELTINWVENARRTFSYSSTILQSILWEHKIGGNWENTALDSTAKHITFAWNNRWEPIFKRTCLSKTQVVPNAPSNLSVNPTKKKDDAKMKLQWQDNSGDESGFIVDRSLDGTSWITINSTADNVTEYIDEDLKYNTKYFYRVAAFNSNGKSAYTNIASNLTFTGLAEADAMNDNLIIYPNPAHKQLNIQFIANASDIVTFIVSNVNGQQVLNSSATVKTGLYNETIDISNLQAGIYFISIQGNYTIAVRKIIVTR